MRLAAQLESVLFELKGLDMTVADFVRLFPVFVKAKLTHAGCSFSFTAQP